MDVAAIQEEGEEMRNQELLQVKQNPLLMSGPLVNATLKDLKTQTRRVIAWSNSYVDGQITKFWREHWHELDFSKAWPDYGPSPAGNPGPYLHVPFPPEGTVHRVSPRYQVGDLIWIKETWNVEQAGTQFAVRYHADGERIWIHESNEIHLLNYLSGEDDGRIDERKRSSRFMPKWAARLWLVVKKVRPEWLQSISEEDAIAEGVTVPMAIEILVRYYGGSKHRVAFASLWDSINGKRYPYKSNPMVWVYGYERKP